MSGWRRLLEEESEHQWLSFAAFTVLVIIGALLIDSSNELSGIHEGGQMNVEGTIIDSAGEAILYQAENGTQVSLNGISESAVYATCLVEHGHITFACLGQEGLIWFTEDDHPEDWGWIPMNLGHDIIASQLSPNDLNQMLIITQEGTANSIAAIEIEGGGASNSTNHEGNMHLDAVTPTEDGWLVGGSWQAPANWLVSNPASPPMFELILSVQWDGTTNSPTTEIVHMGDEGHIHGIFATKDGYIATGTADTISITDNAVTSLGISSFAAVSDNNQDVWLFGSLGSTSVVIISDGESSIEKLPEPLAILPMYVTCDIDGIISIHGVDVEDSPSALSIDSNARSSFTSMRGIIDLGFILVSILILAMMGWNIADAIRKSEVF